MRAERPVLEGTGWHMRQLDRDSGIGVPSIS